MHDFVAHASPWSKLLLQHIMSLCMRSMSRILQKRYPLGSKRHKFKDDSLSCTPLILDFLPPATAPNASEGQQLSREALLKHREFYQVYKA